jgi:multiple sugar transport system permease protein
LAESIEGTEQRSTKRFGMPAQGQGIEGPLLAWLLLAPAVLLLIGIIIYPVINTILLSFQSYNLMMPQANHWIGFRNYVDAITNSVYGFWASVRWSVLFSVLTTVIAFLIGLAMALILNERLRFRTLWRGMALVPWVIPYVVVAYLFFYMFNSQYGIVNDVLTSIHIFGWQPISHPLGWYGNANLARVAVITAAVWNRFPFFTLMLLAGMQTLPQDLYDAAKVDGANSRDRFWTVTIPGLRGIIAIVTTLSLIWSLNEFAIIWAMTNGGPGVATNNMVIHIYRTGFIEQRIGMAATMSAIWLVILLAFAYFYIRIMEGKAAVE